MTKLQKGMRRSAFRFLALALSAQAGILEAGSAGLPAKRMRISDWGVSKEHAPGPVRVTPKEPEWMDGDSVLLNPGFEQGAQGLPEDWTISQWRPTSKLDWLSIGEMMITLKYPEKIPDLGFKRSGLASVRIISESSNDAQWIQSVSLQPNSGYRLRGWVKTEGVGPATENSVGANLSLSGTWDRSAGIKGTQDWTEERLLFWTGQNSAFTVAARLGFYNSEATGTAYFDDLHLERVPTPESRHFILLFHPEVLAAFDYRAWLEKLDEAYEAMEALVGQAPYDGRKIVLQAVNFYPGGALVAGNPILWYQPSLEEAIRGMQTMASNRDLGFGPIHEIGHDFDLPDPAKYYMHSYPDDRNDPLNAEHWANLKLTYVADTLAQKHPEATFEQRGVYVPIGESAHRFFVERFALPWLKSGRKDWRHMDNDHFTGVLYLLKEKIGWEPFMGMFRDFASMTESPPESDLGKVQLIARLLSEHAGKNLIPFFQQFGFEIEADPSQVKYACQFDGHERVLFWSKEYGAWHTVEAVGAIFSATGKQEGEACRSRGGSYYCHVPGQACKAAIWCSYARHTRKTQQDSTTSWHLIGVANCSPGQDNPR